MLEDLIKELIAAVKENTASLKGSKGGAAAAIADAPATGKKKPAAAAAASKFTADEVRTGLNRVKDEVSLQAAKTIIAGAKFPGMKELLLEPKCFDKVMAAVEAALTPAEDDDLGGGDDDDDDL